MYEIQQRYIARREVESPTLRAVPGEITMTAANLYPLQIMGTDSVGNEHDLTAACRFQCDNADLLSFSTLYAIGQQSEGSGTITATYTDHLGQESSVQIPVTVSFFPVKKGLFDPSILLSGTYSQSSTYGTYKAEVGGMGGWTYRIGVNLSEYNYLVADLHRASLAKPILCLYDTYNTDAPHFEAEFGSNKQVIVNLKEAKLTDGTSLDASHIYVVGFYATKASSIAIDGITLCMEDPATGIISVDQSKNSPVYYDLTGRRVNNNHRGIYIHDGKKVIR